MPPTPFPDDAPLVQLIGDTPLVDLSALSPNPAVTIHGKLESANPGGSVKDRPALFIARAAWRHLSQGATLVDATSGNTGIAYAVLGQALGFDVHLFMPENASEERKERFRLHGATLTLTPGEEGQDGAIDRCQAFLEDKDEGAFLYADQYSNEANPQAHLETTGPELLTQTDGRLTHLVTGIGTGGTITGLGRYLAKEAPDVEVVGLQPAEPLHGMEGWKHLPTNHRPAVLDDAVIHRTRTVTTMDAWEAGASVLLATGLAVGPSAGAGVAACIELAHELDEGHLVTILPDGFDRYRSTLYADHVRDVVAARRGEAL